MSLCKSQLKMLQKVAEKGSEKSSFKLQLGAVIFKKKKIISVGTNKNKTHPFPRKFFKFGTIHAEIDAVMKAKFNPELKDASIFVFRKTNFLKTPANAKPCPQCVLALQEYGIKEAYWTTSNFPYWDSATIKKMAKDLDRGKIFEENKI
jgi:tRNA(Arg) A34 adenosine deaminase TadA